MITAAAAPPAGPSGSAVPLASRRGAATVGSVLLAVAAVLGWWVASTRTFVVPTPGDTLGSLIVSLGEASYVVHVAATARAVALAVVLSILVGLVIGLLFGLLPRFRSGFEPLVVASNGVPKIVLYPVLLLMLGMGTSSKVALGVLIGLFPVLMNVSAGLRDVPDIYRRLARTLEASRWQMFWLILVPAIRRPMMTGVRLAVSLATVGVVLAEIFSTQYGLGRVILSSYTAAQYDRMLATVLLLFGFAFITTMVLWRLERRLDA